MFPRFFLILLFLFNMLFSQSLLAVAHTYEAKIPVANQSETAKREAIQKALTEIFHKNFKQAQIASSQEAKEILSNAHDYIQGYKYINEKTSGSLQKYILITFDKEEIDQILKRLGALTITPKHETPAPAAPVITVASTEKSQAPTAAPKPLLIWLVVKTSHQEKPELIEYDQGQAIGKLTELMAKRKEIPILIPELDVESMKLASAENIQKLDPSLLSEISHSYGVSNILAGRLYQQENSQWEGKWLFKKGDQWIDIQTQGETPEANLSSVFETIKGKLELKSTVVPAEEKDERSEPFLIQVHHINNLDNTTKLLQYLRGLSVVKQVETIGIQADSVTLQIQVMGGKSAFQRLIEQAGQYGKLIPVSMTPEPDTTLDEINSKHRIDLQYDWQDPTLSASTEY